MANLEVTIGKTKLKNPVLTASGTFGYGEEFEDFLNIDELGGIIVKATTASHREGNKPPRMAETASGMLNSVGLQNKGVDYFIGHIYPRIQKYKTCLFVNVAGSTVDEYVEVAEKLNDLTNLAGIELNISCPNVKKGGMSFGTHPETTRQVVKSVRKVYSKTLVVKLSPNVTGITEFALIAQDEGADSISLINTLLGMAIDIKSKKPVLSTITGGLSGPAVKPVALRMVWQCSKVVEIPVIGIGGIMNATDAIEFMLAGASAIQVGTANFIDPCVSVKICQDLEKYLNLNNISSISDLVGTLDDSS
ncbi:dihydroorotate dehydrogenase [Bacteroidota bacterium]